MTGRVALDVHALQVPGYAERGIGRYVAGYARALCRRRAVAAALLAPELPPAVGLPGELVAAGLVRWDSQTACRHLLSEVGPPVVYHVTAPFLHCEPGQPAGLGVAEHWARTGLPRVVLLHDLIPLRAPRHYLAPSAMEERYRARAEWVAGSDLIVTNSEYTRREAVELLQVDPSAVATIGAGVSRYFSPPDGTDEELWRFHLRDLGGRPYLMTVGGSDVRKGTDRAIAAFAQLVRGGADVALLVAGHLTDRWRSDLGRVARGCGVEDRVLFLGAVDDELLRACYRRAELTVMPSLAEGAGLPVLESAACGTPALASATTALAETAAVPEALFDPTDTDSIAASMSALLADPVRQARILAAQQAAAGSASWDAVAGRALAAMGRITRARPEGWSAPPRWALVAGPARTGPDLDGVVAALASTGRAEVTCVGFRAGGAAESGSAGGTGSAGGAGGAGSAVPGPGVALAAFGSDVRPASFDQVVYRLGAERGGPIGRLARRFPGWVWLDDVPPAVRLAGLAGSARGFLVGSPAVGREVELLLAPLRPHPPVVVLPAGPGSDPDPGGRLQAAEELAAALYQAVEGAGPPLW